MRLTLDGYWELPYEQRKEFDNWLVTNNLMHLGVIDLVFGEGYVDATYYVFGDEGERVAMAHTQHARQRRIATETPPPVWLVEYCE